MWHSFILETACMFGKLKWHLMRWPQLALCSLASTPDQGSIAVQLHLLECFVVHYTSSACWGSEWAEKGSACGWHVLHLLKVSNIIRAYKESCLPSQGHCLFRLLICLLLCTDSTKYLIMYKHLFYSINNCTSNLHSCLCTMLVTENWHFKIKL